jgi:hypothetical protein
MNARLADDPDWPARYRAAHERYLARRNEIEDVRRCRGLGRRHADAGEVPARPRRPVPRRGPGRNPFGDETLAAITSMVDGRPLRAPLHR